MYKKIADVILEYKTFDITKNNPSNCPTIHELIALAMNSHLSDYYKFKLAIQDAPEIKTSFEKARNYIQDKLGYPVYKFMEDGKKNIEFVTIDKNYRNAKSGDCERMERKTTNSVKKTVTEIKIKHPERLNPLAVNMQKLLTV